MQITKFSLLQFVVFLEKLPLNEFASIHNFNETNKLIDFLKKTLDYYYTEYATLEKAQVLKSLPYINQANELRKTYSGDELPAKLEALQKEADSDKELAERAKALAFLKEKEDGLLTEVDLPAERKEIAQNLFETKALQYAGWASKAVVAELAQLVE